MILILLQKRTTHMQRIYRFWNCSFILFSRKTKHTLTLQFLNLLLLRYHLISVQFAYHYQKMTMITKQYIWLDGAPDWLEDRLHLFFKELFLLFFHKGMRCFSSVLSVFIWNLTIKQSSFIKQLIIQTFLQILNTFP